MRNGETPRVARLVEAYRRVYHAKRPVAAGLRLLPRIAAVLPQLSRAETDAYYAAVQRLRLGDRDHP